MKNNKFFKDFNYKLIITNNEHNKFDSTFTSSVYNLYLVLGVGLEPTQSLLIKGF